MPCPALNAAAMDPGSRSLRSFGRNDGSGMLDDATRAIALMFSAPLRAVLW
jgi:hypothetical protein